MRMKRQARMSLVELRESRHVKQKQMAVALGITQASVSRIEARDDVHVTTLRKYVAALGGQVHLVARFDDEDIAIKITGRKRMWKLAGLGEQIEADMGKGFMPYTVERTEQGRVGLAMVASRLAHNEMAPVYPMPREGQEVRIRQGEQERRGIVREMRGGLIRVGPASMKHDQEGADGPYCWQESVAGKKTGVASGFGFGSKLPKATPVYRHECPGCGSVWLDSEWGRLAAWQV